MNYSLFCIKYSIQKRSKMKAGILVNKSYEILWKFFRKNALEFEVGIFEVPLPKKYEIKFFSVIWPLFKTNFLWFFVWESFWVHTKLMQIVFSNREWPF